MSYPTSNLTNFNTTKLPTLYNGSSSSSSDNSGNRQTTSKLKYDILLVYDAEEDFYYAQVFEKVLV